MSKKEMYEARTEELITPILDRRNFELVDVEYVKEGSTWYLRVYIDKEGGITSDDCADVSREMNEILDREDYVEGSYTFEVSSPGLGRPLKKEKDYIRSMGKELEIRTYRAIDREKPSWGRWSHRRSQRPRPETPGAQRQPARTAAATCCRPGRGRWRTAGYRPR